MTFDDGIVSLYNLTNTAAAGDMPSERLTLHAQAFFGERVVGYGRQYSAKSVNEQIDMLIRIWEDRGLHAGMYAVIGPDQFRIDNVQHLLDDDGLRVTDLTLRRLEENYDIDTGEA